MFLVTLYREYDTSELQTLLTCSNTRRMQTKVVENKEYSQYLTNYAPTELGIAPEQLIYLEPALAGLPTYKSTREKCGKRRCNFMMLNSFFKF